MGVLGLWQILEPVGHPIKIEGLEGKRLGVDANIWLYKFIRGFREKDNASSIDSHKLGLFNRICKLLFYKIKPVFVFDGPAPQLKRRTLERRQNVRNKNLTKIQTSAMRLLAEHLKEQYPDVDVKDVPIRLPEFRSNNLAAAEKLTDEDRNLFYLPPAKQEQDCSSDEEMELFRGEVDVHSEDFKKLPPEIRYEILKDNKQNRKIRRAEALPEDASDFSAFQLRKLKARRAIQEKIEECEKEICGSYTGEMTYRIQSDPNRFMIYTKPQAPKQEPNEQPEPRLEQEQQLDQPRLSVLQETRNPPSQTNSQETRVSPTQKTDKVQTKVIEEIELESDTELESDAEPEPKSLIEVESDTEIESDSNSDTELDSDKIPGPKSGPEPESNTDLESEPELLPVSKSDTEHESDTDLESVPELVSSPEDQEQSSQKQLLDQQAEKQPERMPTPSSQEMGSTTTSQESRVSPSREADKIPDKQVEEIELESDREPEPELVTLPEERQQIEQKRQPDPQPELSQPQRPMPSASQETRSSTNLTSSQDSRVLTSRETNKVTAKIVDEAKELLRLFGIPYIDAAGEAEAQCALLETLNLTEGTITDDSDIWLFGAKHVYRYFFSDDKWVMQYKMPDIEFHIRMTRENLVCFAMLVGSDYTDGLSNVGPVTALEILSEFQGDDLTPLLKYKEFVDEYRSQKGAKRITGTDIKKRKRLLKFDLPEEFPSRPVFDGYMRPVADASTEEFTWGVPDLDELREYARRNFGWEPKRIDEKLLPVMKKLSERKTQPTIDSYFFKTAANQNPELFRSKRVNEALKKISSKDATATTATTTTATTTSATDKKKEKPKKTPKGRKQPATRRGTKRNNRPVPEVVCLSETEDDEVVEC